MKSIALVWVILLAILSLALWFRVQQDMLQDAMKSMGSGYSGAVSYLVNHGGNVNAIEEQSGETLLIRAVKAKDRNCIAFLLENGANPLIQDRQGHDALHYGISK